MLPSTQPVLSIHEPLLVNTLGHCAGAIVFGIFLALVIRDRQRGNRLLMAAAVLALLWNAGSLAVLLLPARGMLGPAVAAFSFSVLSLLPAVLLHLSLQGTLPAAVVTGYLLSFAAIVAHLSEALRPDLDLHKTALLLVTAGFAVLTGVSVLRVLLHGGEETRGRTSRIVGSMCLLLFAISFAHFGSNHPAEAWSKELVVHHAGIPLALLILLQDYRFVLLDAFVRFLANVMVAAVLSFGALELLLRLHPADRATYADPLLGALMIAGGCLLLIAFAFLRGGVQEWLTRVVFRRGDLESLIQEIHLHAVTLSGESAFLPWVAGRVAELLRVSRFDLVDAANLKPIAEQELAYPALANELALIRTMPGIRWVEVVVPLRLSPQDVRFLLLGRRRGGRRYLSEDLRSLSRLSALIVEEVERFRSAEMQRLVSQAELRALQSQINPHFLFNALNTVYGMIPRDAGDARRTVQNLSDIFRYFLQSDRTFIPLAEEMKIVHAYLEIEHLRLGTRLRTQIDMDESLAEVPIPILSIQPLVENAIKHGIAARPDGGRLRIAIRRAEQEVVISVENSGAEMRASAALAVAAGVGVGLTNVTRRLQLCYGSQAGVVLQSGASGTSAQFSVPAPKLVPSLPGR